MSEQFSRDLLIRIDQKVDDLHSDITKLERRIFGNGQPGELDRINRRVSTLADRTSALERFRWWLTGIGVCGTAFGWMLRSLVERNL